MLRWSSRRSSNGSVCRVRPLTSALSWAWLYMLGRPSTSMDRRGSSASGGSGLAWRPGVPRGLGDCTLPPCAFRRCTARYKVSRIARAPSGLRIAWMAGAGRPCRRLASTPDSYGAASWLLGKGVGTFLRGSSDHSSPGSRLQRHGFLGPSGGTPERRVLAGPAGGSYGTRGWFRRPGGSSPAVVGEGRAGKAPVGGHAEHHRATVDARVRAGLCPGADAEAARGQASEQGHAEACHDARLRAAAVGPAASFG